ncbi:STAS/SEC14 domain-containing protein [Rivihabitans pingtungensis]|jgi:hypothetical protein|uniref:SpoIIAA-like protein n=1 Tax=Rivihabitans pingtungensis TaxID=1054498 RepID=A0A318L1J8_9NEIS|nr:STAS/SEC14 domain-containing protein [Rivihabitans pingtungensis]MCK6436091.1 STAS/SEC14 domain-containing protein [Rivihabitans pingtungensis]PXX81815.1 SpoIIAA-like protein [Rivihabitans pingtungensis]HNX70821.1 STAS/SEC14 domain-containing protein [Rivihabitans pingtungensis]
MISIQQQSYGLDVALFATFTVDDFRAFETAVLARAQTDGRVNVLLNLSGLLDFTIDMALEELRFVREHEQEFGRIAIVAPEGWLNLAAHIAGLLSHTDSEYFDTPEDALAWLNAN